MDFKERKMNTDNVSILSKDVPLLAPVSRKKQMPVSTGQERLWYLSQVQEPAYAYNEQLEVCINGSLDVEFLKRSLKTIVERHETLRAVFIQTDEGDIRQTIVAPFLVDLPVISVGEPGMSEEALKEEVDRVALEQGQAPYDLSTGPLFRACILQLPENKQIFLFSCHHIMLDGRSLEILLKEINALYTAELENTSPVLSDFPVQWVDYACWEQQWVKTDAVENRLNYWKKQLQGLPPSLDLPLDCPRPTEESFYGAWEFVDFPKKLTEKLVSLSWKERVPSYVVILAAYKVLLMRYTRQTDIAVGSIVANRTHPEVTDLLGFFAETVVLRSDLTAGKTFKQLLREINTVSNDAFYKQAVPFSKLIKALRSDGTLSADVSPIQAALVFDGIASDEKTFAGQDVTRLSDRSLGTSKFDITMSLKIVDGQLKGYFEYNSTLFNNSTIKRFLQHFHLLLESVAEDINQNIDTIPFLKKEERQQLLVDWNNTKATYPDDQCIHQLFEIQAEKTPTAVAVVYEDQQLTYEQLNSRSNQLAHYLIEQGVGPEVRVALCLERSFELIIGVLAVLKAGGGYVPIDPEYPIQRIEYLLADSGAVLLLTQEDLAHFEFSNPGLAVLCLDRDWPKIGDYNTVSPAVITASSNLAHIIYTSGSTGNPKGVVISHQSVNRLVINSNYLDLRSGLNILQAASISFDAATFEIWAALLNGNTCVLYPERIPTAEKIESIITEQNISILFLTTALFNLIVDENPNVLNKVKEVFIGGEAASSDHIMHAYKSCSDIQIKNFYGPTEGTTFTTYYPIPRDREKNAMPVPIGRPINNTTTFILDVELNPVPVGVVGELYIGGDGLAREYLGRADITAEKFIPNPFSLNLGDRLYKTGDLVRYEECGEIDFVGRIDFQVKIRGFRIELGEIESALIHCDNVHKSIVLVCGDEREERGRYLVAYVTGDNQLESNQSLLRDQLKEKLPEYMIPSFFVFLDEFPLTSNGKIDRKSLPEPDVDTLKKWEYIAPSTDIEKGLAGIWSDILKIPADKIGANDDFFDLGGHSLLATRVVSHVRKAFNAEIQIRDLFSAATVQHLAVIVNDAINKKSLVDDKEFPLVSVERTDFIPLSFAQQRIWFLDRLEGGNDISYNMAWVFRLTGNLNVNALKSAFQALIKRHESLRTTFHAADEGVTQHINDELRLDIPLIDVTAAWVSRYIDENATHVFDLEKGPLIKASILRVLPNEHILLINMHHIISDGWSMGIFNHEIAVLYEAYKEGKESPLPQLPIQYADFSYWQRQWLQEETLEEQLSYWRCQLQGAPELLEFPTDRPRPAIQSYRGDAENFIIPKSLTDQLNVLGREQNATLFMVLMAAFKVLLYRYSGVKDLCVGTVVANRQRQELEGLIGFFVNTLILRDQIDDASTFKHFLQQVKGTALSAYAHQDIPFEHLVDELNPQRNLSYMPLAQVVLVLQNASKETLALQGLTVSPVDEETLTSKFDLIMDLVESPEGIVGRLEYSKDLFEKETMARFVAHFQNLLGGIAEKPEQCLFKLSVLSEIEHKKLVEFNGREVAYEAYKNIPQLFEQQVKISPNAIAVAFEEETLTYDLLDQYSSQLAHYLIERGVGPEDRVGLCVSRSLDMVVAILAILKAGGAYVPIDPDNPSDRIKYILEDSSISLLLTEASVQDKTLHDQVVSCICIDSDWPAITQCSTEMPVVNFSLENLAYVIYTSGSTGRPKGTLITHANVVRLFTATQEQYQFNENDVWTLFHSFAFDFSVWEIWGALFYGGKVIVVPYWVSRESERFCQLVYNEGVTVLNQTPSAFNQFIATDKALALAPETLKLRYVIFGGEALDMPSLQPWFERHGDQQPQLVNMYGITETTVHVTHYPVNKLHSQGASSIIGKKLSDLQAYIMDSHMQIAPIGVPGELYVGGGGIARGYHGRPDLTAERFIPNPFSKTPGSQLYKTGDLVRFQADGNMEYLGRIDQQVKVRGFRIELGEIQSRLLEHDAIQESAVIVREDQPGDKRLVAYLVLDSHYELPQTETTQLSTEAVSQWQDVFENNYSATTAEDPFQDFTGWNDSYGGKVIPEDQMREWADDTAQSILALKPKNILEIACGTGLLTGRLVPHCESYVGTDFSSTVLQQLHDKLPRLGEHAEKVRLISGPANDLSELEGEKFDTIILNSVVQYFPDLDYLLTTLEQAKKLLSPGGCIFVGDIRHLGLLEAFHASIQLHKEKSELIEPDEFKRLVHYHATNDNELVIAPEFFHAFKAQSPDINHVQVIPKWGSYQNELGAYRYDVVFHTANNIDINKEVPWISWQESRYSLQQTESHLSQIKPSVFALRGVPNRQIFQEVQTLNLCESDREGIDKVSDINEKIGRMESVEVTPNELKKLAESLSYSIEFSWLGGGSDGSFDVVFTSKDSSGQAGPLNMFPYEEQPFISASYKALANNPRLQDLKRELLSSLRDYLKECIPDYMVPSSFVFLDELPLTGNGKLDRKALPAPDSGVFQTEAYQAPGTVMEDKLATIWAEVLQIPKDIIGIRSDFFELGGHSLKITQVASRIKTLFSLDISIPTLFTHPTIEGLAKYIESSAGELSDLMGIDVDNLTEEEADRLLAKMDALV